MPTPGWQETLELADEDFKAAMVKILQNTPINMPETEKNKKLQQRNKVLVQK